ncbi:MAG: site-2 protease family protein [Oscillospiraceae bacterium]|nr:site-2 protease family protein [Oscillospiraceae bacterium]
MKISKVHISIPFFVLLALLYVFDFGEVFFPAMLAVFLHEAAHLFAIRCFGGTIEKIDIRAFGIRVNVPELKYMSYKKEIIIAAAGPLAGIVAAGVSLLAANIFKSEGLFFFAGINFVITAINLIPVFPLDGGRITLSLMLWLFSVRFAYVVNYVLTIVSIGVLLGVCVVLAINGSLNPSLVIFSMYISICGIKHRVRF